MTKRPGTWSDDDRALVGRDRRVQSDAPEPVTDELSGAIEDPDARRAVRGKRPTKVRLGKVEDKQDKTDVRIGAVEQTVARMDGKLDTVLELLGQQQRTERVRITSRAKVIVAVVGTLGVIAGAVVAAMAGCA